MVLGEKFQRLSMCSVKQEVASPGAAEEVREPLWYAPPVPASRAVAFCHKKPAAEGAYLRHAIAMAYARLMACSLCQLYGLCMQVRKKVSKDIEHIETELVSSVSRELPAS